MTKFVIALPDADKYVRDFSNTLAQPVLVDRKVDAKQFDTIPDAHEWAQAYLPSYKYLVQI